MSNDTVAVVPANSFTLDTTARTFIWIICGAVIQTVNLFGIVSNIINIMCFAKQGLKEAINISFLGLAVSDLCALVTASLLNIWFTLWLSEADLTFEPISLGYVSAGIPHVTFVRVTSWITAIIIIERCLCILMPLKVHILITPRRMSVIIACVFIMLLACGTPIYVVNTLSMKYFPSKNRTLLTIITAPNGEAVEALYYTVNNFLLPCFAFMVIGVCTVILVYKLNDSARWRSASTKAVSDNVSTRNQKAAKMVVMISVLFIACFIPVSMAMLIIALLPDFNFGGKYVSVTIIVCNALTLLESINSSANIFIYMQMSSKYKDTFSQMFLKVEHQKTRIVVK